MPTAAQQAFVVSNYNNAALVSAQTGLPVEYVLGQAALESGYGTNTGASVDNNPFSISPGGALANYPSMSSGFDAYAQLVNNHYAGALSYAASNPGDYAGIAQTMAQEGYCCGSSGNSTYGASVANATQSVASILAQNGLQTGVVSPFGTMGPQQPGVATQIGSYVSGAVGGAASAIASPVLSWLGDKALSIVFVLLGIVLVGGAVYLFGKSAVNKG